ncbi:helix-turn-helix domain-containing protein [Bdellovibrio svalbardensis]|uniref:helix-turn-helix domain-containing protein n=1 Tax=Bdellovibrio svalbardensis TaxID=2972972 RepID=UPI0038993E39
MTMNPAPGAESERFSLFENLKALLTPNEVCELLGISIKTIYDWKYRGALRGVPRELFVKLNRRLFIRTDILRKWIFSQNGIYCP